MKAIVYSTASCPYCKMAKEFLEANGVSYTDYNVGEDRQKAEEMVAKSGQMGVPVIEIGGRIIVGFDRKALEDALGAEESALEAKK